MTGYPSRPGGTRIRAWRGDILAVAGLALGLAACDLPTVPAWDWTYASATRSVSIGLDDLGVAGLQTDGESWTLALPPQSAWFDTGSLCPGCPSGSPVPPFDLDEEIDLDLPEGVLDIDLAGGQIAIQVTGSFAHRIDEHSFSILDPEGTVLVESGAGSSGSASAPLAGLRLASGASLRVQMTSGGDPDPAFGGLTLGVSIQVSGLQVSAIGLMGRTIGYGPEATALDLGEEIMERIADDGKRLRLTVGVDASIGGSGEVVLEVVSDAGIHGHSIVPVEEGIGKGTLDLEGQALLDFARARGGRVEARGAYTIPHGTRVGPGDRIDVRATPELTLHLNPAGS